MIRLAAYAFVIATLLLAAAPAQEGDVGGVHDPCIIQTDGVYYLFTTGRGVPIRTSKDLITWHRAGQTFSENVPAWALEKIPEARSIWAPDISFHDGEYRLYYSVSRFGSFHSFIGLATNKTLDPTRPDYHWQDQGAVIESVPERDKFNAIDPNVATDETGALWLTFGSFRSGGIQIVQLDAKTGKPAEGAKPASIAARPKNGNAIEAPFIVRHGEQFYLFVSFDLCCKGVDSTYKVAVGRAPKIDGPYLDTEGHSMLQGGGTVVLASAGQVHGPGHEAVLSNAQGDWLVHHYYDGNDNGRSHLQIRPITWKPDGFPAIGEPIK